MEAIDIRNLSFSYGKEPFIQDFSVSFQKGAVTSIVGPNGCGKSTLVKLIDGLCRPTQGCVLVGDTPTLEMNSRQRARQIAVLAQSRKAPPMTVGDLVACGRNPYVGYGGKLGPQDREEVDRALQLTGIERFRDHDLRHLSGGERQRAFFAMTLAQDTDIIVLDEPTTYLDVKACHELMVLVRDLNRSMGKTIVMVIHDIDLALRYSDRVMVMQNGASLYCGPVQDARAVHAIEGAFDVAIRDFECEFGTSFALFPVAAKHVGDSA